MSKMKLISMTDFVLEQVHKMEDKETAYLKIFNYAKFLKTPLTLGMFVPCDESEKVLDVDNRHTSDYEHLNKELNRKYNKAKERVLFDGFSADEGFLVYYDFYVCKESLLHQLTVEDLFNLMPKNNYPTLTPYALKQIGL